MDVAKEADEMHKKFRHEESDFLTLLNIWNAYHDEMERLTQNQLRKFCKSHFLSYLRMREWRDIHSQLKRTLKDIKMFRESKEPAEYDQVHRALLSGLLSGVAQLEETNHYRATRNRKVMVFPGSTLFHKVPYKKKRAKGAPAPREPKPASAKWILSAEFMETTRLYARTVARIDPMWILRVGEHVLAHRYTDPVYDEKGERVMVRERILLYGLEIATKRTAYVRINAKEATEIFVREALVEGRLRTSTPFHEHNQSLLEEIRDRQTRLRMHGTWALEERLYRFYDERLQSVGSFGDMKGFIRDQHGGKADFLYADEKDLLPGENEEDELSAFPDSAELSGIRLDLSYAYKPGDEDDGATLKIPVEQFEAVDAGMIDWAVPGYIRQRIEFLLRGLPKETRKQLFPMADVVQELALAVSPQKGSLVDQLTRLLGETRGIRIWPTDWAPGAVPEYLKPRVEVIDQNERTVATGRDWSQVSQQYREAVRTSFKKGEGHEKLQVWQEGCRTYELKQVHPDTLPKLPLELVLGDIAGLPVKAWPGLETGKGGVSVKLFADEAASRRATASGFAALCEDALGKDFGWMQRDLVKEVRRVGLGFAFMMDTKTLAAESFAMLRRSMLACENPLPLDPGTLKEVVGRAREQMRGLVPEYVDLLETILQGRERVMEATTEGSPWRTELDALLHVKFLRQLNLSRLSHYTRYLEALFSRIQRARQNPSKDAEKARPLVDYIRRYAALKAPVQEKRQLRWLLEEYKVQVFAQELGTAGKVSPKIVEAAFARLES
jgi:ATP-dependent helicase HrpA